MTFPASPRRGQRFYRTDLGLWFVWDGHRWLSEYTRRFARLTPHSLTTP